MKTTNPPEADIIAAVRAETLAPSTWLDEELMVVMKGSLLLSRIRLRLAVCEFKTAVLESPFGRFLSWLVRLMHKVIRGG